ncbi:unnamed protein product [Pipistrellus nathusii]|uniref:Ig-like domain-containing protein n=1 Tax=Pipistrellus nathusii TaxID=59473 RepID=A0ABN9ZLT5_PIPNA
MESPSDPAHRGLVPWKGLLLAASLLTLWSVPTTAQLTIESVPPNAAEGKDVLLCVHNLPGNLLGYTWYKGEIRESSKIISYIIYTQTTISWPAYSGRETIYHNGSHLLQNITLKDTGKYILQAIDKDFDIKQVTGQLRVYSVLPKPSITSNNSNPEEHKDPVVLTCEPQTENTTYLWFINSQRLLVSARLQLSKDNRTLTLLLVTWNDTGPYECETQNLVSAGRSDPFTLNVLYGPDAPTISPSDSHYIRGTNLSLSCQAASNPPAQYSWLINGRPLTTTQELFIPNITLHNSGSYICLAHNSDTGLTGAMVKNITVYAVLHKPRITSNNSNPEEHKDPVMLTCEPQTENTTYLWLINSQRLLVSVRLQMSKDNRNLTLLLITRNDTGPYECETQNPVSASRSDPFTLNVLYGPDTPTISPSDSHYLRGTNLGLSCQAASNPPARYSWLINGRPQQPTQELFIPNITAHDSGSYICLAHNSITGLTGTTIKTITVYAEQTYTGYSVGNIVGIVIGILVMVALGATLGNFLCLRRTRRASDPRDPQVAPPPAATPGQGPSESSAFSFCRETLPPRSLMPSLPPAQGPLPNPKTAGPIYQELVNPNTEVYCQISPRADVAS